MGAVRTSEIYQFKVTLIGITPPVWRRIQVPAGFSLAQLHGALQVAMGWENYHLYMFRVGRKKYGPLDPDEDDDLGLIDAKRTRLRPVLTGVGLKSTYVYDYGDNWEHELLLEAIVMPDAGAAYPCCLGGERHCPPEDAGGFRGYIKYLEAMANPDHDEHEEMMMWRGPFDPEEFSLERVNQALGKKFRSKAGPSTSRSATARPKTIVNSNRTTKTFITTVIPRAQRILVKSDETVPLELNPRERDLIISRTFADESLKERLQIAPQPGQRPVFYFTLDELDELVGDLAAEANHANNDVLQGHLDELCERIEGVLRRHADADA